MMDVLHFSEPGFVFVHQVLVLGCGQILRLASQSLFISGKEVS